MYMERREVILLLFDRFVDCNLLSLSGDNELEGSEILNKAYLVFKESVLKS